MSERMGTYNRISRDISKEGYSVLFLGCLAIASAHGDVVIVDWIPFLSAARRRRLN